MKAHERSNGPGRVMITGGSGNLGKALKRVFPEALSPTRREMDIRNQTMVDHYVATRRPSVIIHAAALTGVRPCEEDKENAWQTNVVGTENLVNAILLTCAPVKLVYVSTACIFAGDRGNYAEHDLPYPKNYYAFTKYIGETVARTTPISLVVRTNFVGRDPWPYPCAFSDRWGTYLFADEVALGIREVLEAALIGTVHIVGSERLSVLDLARMTKADVEPLSMAEYVGPPLTRDMSLDTVRWKRYSIGSGRGHAPPPTVEPASIGDGESRLEAPTQA